MIYLSQFFHTAVQDRKMPGIINHLALARDSSLMGTVMLCEVGIRLFLGIILARILGPEDFGLYTIGITIALFLSVFTTMGFGLGKVYPSLQK